MDMSGEHNCEENQACFFEWLAVALAPTICGSKPSTVLSLMDTRCCAAYRLWKKFGKEFLDGSLVRYKTLRSSERQETVLFYRAEILEKCIMHCQHKRFLARLGYPVEQGMDACLEDLSERFRGCCPHEIGILLGIPFKDVLGFMDKSRLPETCRGEWCVYGNPEASLRVMRRFADDREQVQRMLIEGMSPRAIIRGNLHNNCAASA